MISYFQNEKDLVLEFQIKIGHFDFKIENSNNEILVWLFQIR